MATCTDGVCKGSCGACGQNCTGSNTGHTCSGDCTTGCSGECKGGCTGGSSASCVWCGTDCGGDCSSSVADGGGGGGGCGDCSAGCATGCTTGCTETCQDACDSAVLALYNKLKEGLNKKILAADMKNINDMIQYEAGKRGLSAISQSFTEKHKATVDKVQALQQVLVAGGLSIEHPATQKGKALRATGEELIDKSLAAYEQRVGK